MAKPLTQLPQFTFHLSRFTFHASRLTPYIWIAILVLINDANFAESKQERSSIVGLLSDDSEPGFARAFQPMGLQFPQDHGPHPAYKIEWWYYTGNLKTDDGKHFGYQLNFFRSALTPQIPNRDSNFAANQIYMAHFAVTDVAHGRHFSFERFSRGASGLAGATSRSEILTEFIAHQNDGKSPGTNSSQPGYEIWLEDWSAREVKPGVVRLWAVDNQTDPRVGIDLTLRETRSPVLHGNRGLSRKGPESGNANYYYSLVQLATVGTVTSRGKAMAVSGVSWMDHEFGTSALTKDVVGWDWFGLQLDNGVTLMFGQLRDREGNNQGIFEGTLAYPDGRQIMIAPEDFTLTSIGKWTSPKSGIIYPSGWRVVFPKLKIELRIEPLIPNQEMHASFTYWEGAVQVDGQIDGVPVSGRGYAELTGYGIRY